MPTRCSRRLSGPAQPHKANSPERASTHDERRSSSAALRHTKFTCKGETQATPLFARSAGRALVWSPAPARALPRRIPSPPARWHGASRSWNQECGSLSVLQSARLVSHYARCIPSKALYRRCLQRCSDKGSYRTELKRPRVTEAKCNTGCWPIAHRHSRLPSCAVGIAP